MFKKSLPIKNLPIFKRNLSAQAKPNPKLAKKQEYVLDKLIN